MLKAELPVFPVFIPNKIAGCIQQTIFILKRNLCMGSIYISDPMSSIELHFMDLGNRPISQNIQTTHQPQLKVIGKQRSINGKTKKTSFRQCFVSTCSLYGKNMFER